MQDAQRTALLVTKEGFRFVEIPEATDEEDRKAIYDELGIDYTERLLLNMMPDGIDKGSMSPVPAEYINSKGSINPTFPMFHPRQDDPTFKYSEALHEYQDEVAKYLTHWGCKISEYCTEYSF